MESVSAREPLAEVEQQPVRGTSNGKDSGEAEGQLGVTESNQRVDLGGKLAHRMGKPTDTQSKGTPEGKERSDRESGLSAVPSAQPPEQFGAREQRGDVRPRTTSTRGAFGLVSTSVAFIFPKTLWR